ncbi:hypothetical protein [Neorhizobium sp. JUb45]|uniref:hypothetical protein n=1 Tax=unclassified Neorhizobium TaxID=2629175 RepID=UPI001043BC4A|nr:hypothetical protein [Neorhizobium sp. JUb45]TCR02155.1 hypothetical protein EDF70_104436 [Neorhizobium sp. JUb45]
MAIRSGDQPAITGVVTSYIEHWELTTKQATALVKATDETEIAELEARFGFSQQDAVTHFVEQTEWGLETFPQYQDRRGSFRERLEALRSRWNDWQSC